MDPVEVDARLGVEDTIARYVRYADAGRPEDLAGLFTDDGILIAGGSELHGRAEIVAYLETVKQALAGSTAGGGRIRHHVSSLRIDLTGPNSAEATCYFLAITASGPDHWGVYRDTLVCDDGRWHFASRRTIVEGAAPGSWAEHRTTERHRP